MAAPDEPRHERNDDGQAQTKTLGILVVVMVVAGVIALVMTLFGNDDSKSAAVGQPSGSQVGNQTTTGTSTAPTSSSAPVSTPATSSPASTAPATSAPATTAPVTSSAAKPAAPKPATTAATQASAKPSTKIVKYTVKKGDNLTLIARWFNQRGVSPVYDWNKSVIGRNPNLIFPGQTIIVSLNGDKMNVAASMK